MNAIQPAAPANTGICVRRYRSAVNAASTSPHTGPMRAMNASARLDGNASSETAAPPMSGMK